MSAAMAQIAQRLTYARQRGRGTCARMLAVAILPVAVLLAGAPSALAAQACTGDPNSTAPLTLSVAGQPASGLYALPAGPARALVVFGHGYSYTDTAWVKHMINAATLDGSIAVTMNYRGLAPLPVDSTGYARSRGWPVAAGAQDLIAAGRYFDATCGPFSKIILLGVSMGGNSTGLAAAAQAKRIDGQPLFDYWMGLEGVYNLTELYNQATLVAPSNTFAANAKADIEHETGGTFAQVPQAYTDRTVVDQASKIAGSGLKGVYIVHSVEDGEASYDQAQQMTNALRGDGLATDLYSVTRHAPGDDQGIDTTLSASPTDPNAGHEAEWTTNDIELNTGFDRLTALLVRGEPPPCNRTFMVDGMANPQTTPDPAMPAAGCPAGAPTPPGGGTAQASSAGNGAGGSAGNGSGTSTGLGPGATSTRRCAGPQFTVYLTRGPRRLAFHGAARPSHCLAVAARVTSVRLALARPVGVTGRCRFVRASGHLSAPRSCAKPLFLLGHGLPRWRVRLARPARGAYRLVAVLSQSGGARVRVDRRLSVI